MINLYLQPLCENCLNWSLKDEVCNYGHEVEHDDLIRLHVRTSKHPCEEFDQYE